MRFPKIVCFPKCVFPNCCVSKHDFPKQKFDEIFPNLAKKYELPLIPFLLDKVALKPELNLSDGMHPNEKGILVISKTVKKSIIHLIK